MHQCILLRNSYIEVVPGWGEKVKSRTNVYSVCSLQFGYIALVTFAMRYNRLQRWQVHHDN